MMALGLGTFAFVVFLLPGQGAEMISPLSLKSALGALLIPALWQELVFRVLLLPHPTEGGAAQSQR